MQSHRAPRFDFSAGVGQLAELTFLYDALVTVAVALDPILVIILLGRQKTDDFDAIARRCMKLSARCKGDGVSHSILMGFHRWVYLRV